MYRKIAITIQMRMLNLTCACIVFRRLHITQTLGLNVREKNEASQWSPLEIVWQTTQSEANIAGNYEENI